MDNLSMTTMALYLFLSGPMIWVAFGLFIFGTVFQVIRFYLFTRSTTFSGPASVTQNKKLAPGKNLLLDRTSLGYRLAQLNLTLPGRRPVFTLLTTFFHINLVVLPFFVQGHTMMVGFATDLFLPSLADVFVDLMTILTKNHNQKRYARGYTIERQCNTLYIEELTPIMGKYDAVLSMACGAGVQYVAEAFPVTPVFPAVNTVAIGIDRDIGVYEERCRACGECVVGYTGGVCPVTRCAKGLFNGPCGGTNQGMCEIDNTIPCAWVDIFNCLKAQNRLNNIMKVKPPMEWQNQTQRTIVQERW